MGAQQSNSNFSFLPSCIEVRKEHGGTILADNDSECLFLLHQLNYADKSQYEKQLKKYHTQKANPCECLLNITEIYSKQFNNLCSTSYKIFVVYEYPSITLDEEIDARKKEDKYFQEHQLWAILQSCSNAILQVKPVLSLNPKLIFIGNEGILKIINNDMISEDYRSLLNEEIYYAPQKITNFSKNDEKNNLKKEGIFSLGMTILHSALLLPVHDCYDYENFNFLEENLESHLELLSHRYSEQFVQILRMILEITPNKRSSLMEIKGMVTQVWNTEQNSKIEDESESEGITLQSEKEEEVKKIQQKKQPNFQQSYNSIVKKSVLHEISNEHLFTDPKLLHKPKDDLFTDPKLLQMIRQDLHNLNELKQSTLRHDSYIEPHSHISHNSHNISVLQSSFKHLNTSYRPSQPYSYYASRKESFPIRKSIEPEIKMYKRKNQAIFITEEYQNGSRFEGMSLNGVKEGPGKFFYENGAFFQGNFKDDKIHGRGILYYGFKKPAYDGQWEEDQFHGFGVLSNELPESDGQPYDYNDFNEIDKNWLRYEGFFNKDFRAGFGKLFLANGEVFEGEFFEDYMNGHGKFTTLNGDVVTGIWSNNILMQLEN